MFFLESGLYTNFKVINMIANIDATTATVTTLFFTGSCMLMVGIPFYIMQYIMLRRFNSISLEYVLCNSSITSGQLSLNSGSKSKKLNKIVALINNLPEDCSEKAVRRVVEKSCGYIPVHQLIIMAILAVPITYTTVMLICVTFGDESFLGFFLLLGLVGAAIVAVPFAAQHIQKIIPPVHMEIEYKVIAVQNLKEKRSVAR